jgi:hypothetical protein
MHDQLERWSVGTVSRPTDAAPYQRLRLQNEERCVDTVSGHHPRNRPPVMGSVGWPATGVTPAARREAVGERSEAVIRQARTAA